MSEIFERALAEPEADRDAFLARECGGDRTLEAEVRSLLGHHRASGDFLEPGSAALAPLPPAAAANGLGAGVRIGAWRLVRPLGEGGMGTVWLAERADGEYTQKGALKLIRLGLASEEMIRRFRRERQILAALDHPNIAHLLDGGSTPDGLPYLVMEYVEGRPLYQECEARNLGLVARVNLFLALCAAVHVAHQKLILHRDIKPSNVLVTRDGTPKLLDFGVGKIFDEQLLDPHAELRTQQLPLTPLYASPEQLRGDQVSTASDVYSLGVLLYELLSGAPAHPARSGSTPDVIRTVLETDPARPSAAVTQTLAEPDARVDARAPLPPPPIRDAAALRRRLSGDLDTIVLKAMDRDPARRYASAERLASDLRRYLTGRPIDARPDSWAYRTSTFVRRNRVMVGAGALVLAALVAGLALSAWQASVARRQRRLAEERLREVQGLAHTLMFDVYDGIENMPGATAVRQTVIAKAAGYLDALAEQAGADSSVRFSLADAYERLGTAQRQAWVGGSSGNTAGVRSYQRSRELREGLLHDYPDNERALYGLTMIYTRIGSADEVAGRLPEALDLMQRAARCNARLVALHPGHPVYEAGLPRRYNNLGLAYMYNRRTSEAVAEFRRAIEGYTALALRDTSDWQQRRLLAMSLTLYAQCLLERPEATDSAITTQRRALGLYQDLWRRRPADLDLEVRVADGHERLAEIVSYRTGPPELAVSEVAIAQRMVESVAARDPANRDNAVDAADGRACKGLVLAAAGHTATAAQLLGQVGPQLERWAREDSTDTRLASSLPQVYLGMGLVHMSQARATQGAAAPQWRAARDSFQRAQHAHDRGIAIAGPWELASDEEAWITHGLAACDSALAGAGRQVEGAAR